MPDAGEIKAKVTIEYDGSGLDKAKEDLASLGDISGTVVDAVGEAGDALSGMGEQLAIGAGNTQLLGQAMGGLEKPLMLGQAAISEVSDSAGNLAGYLGAAGSAFEDLGMPMDAVTRQFVDAAPPMLAVAEHAQSLQDNLSGVNDSFSNIVDSTAQVVPLLPQVTESMGALSETVGSPHFAENMSVFQDALENPEPFSLIQGYLGETGQTWDDFTSSIGSDNTAMLHEMATTSDQVHPILESVSSGFEDTGQRIADSIDWSAVGPPTDWSAGMEDATSSVQDMGTAVEETGKTVESSGFDTFFTGVGHLFSDPVSGIMNGLNAVAMPLMAVQMVGMAVSTVATGIYNAAVIAEGPAAHGIGTFTGAMDTMAASSANAWQQFSEGFGQGVLPTIDAINSVTTQNGGGSNFWGAVGGAVGGTLGTIGDVVQIIGGGIIGGAAKTLTLDPGNTAGQDWIQSGWQGLQNSWALLTGAPEPFPGPVPPSQQAVQSQAAIQQMYAQANDPQYLAAQAYYSSQASQAQQAQAVYNVSHYGGSTGPDDPLNNIIQAELVNEDGGNYGGTPDPNRAFFDSFDDSTVGCFPAGTRVLMADGREIPIETVCLGDRVLASDGTKQVSASVLALIMPPPKQVYELIFTHGIVLTLTDAHPIATPDGWKSLSPQATKRENPDLPVSMLQVGDVVHTASSVCTLLSIHSLTCVQVYNITVDAPHTFYANGVLVHNKIGDAIMQNVADTTVPSFDLSKSNLIQSITANFSAADLTHTFTATASWVGQGLENTFSGIASWVGQNLEQAFTGVASWAGQNLEQAFTGVASWVGQNLQKDFTAAASWAGQNLEKAFTGVASWAGQNLEQAFTGVASWIGQNLGKEFTGIASWIGQNLEHTFTAVASWVGQGLQQTFTAVASFVGLPGYAQGIMDSPTTHVAVVGEQGPEIMVVPQGASIFPSYSGSGAGASLGALVGASSPSSAATGGSIIFQLYMDSQQIASGVFPLLSQQIRLYAGRRM